MKAYSSVFSKAPFLHQEGHSYIIMRDIFIALILLFISSIIFFGYASILVVGIAYISAGILVWIYKFTHKRFYFDSYAWHNTILIYSLSLPPQISWYVIVFGVLCIFILGQTLLTINKKNIFHPALVGRICIMTLFPHELFTQWTKPLPQLFPIVLQQNIQNNNNPSIVQALWDACHSIAGFDMRNIDIVSSATPLGIYDIFKYQYHQIPISISLTKLNWLDIFLGNRGGALGETSIALLIIIFLWLSFRKVINPLIPILYLGVYTLWVWCFGGLEIGQKLFYLPILPYTLCGASFYTAILILTDYSMMPHNKKAYYIMTILAGIVSGSLFVWSKYPDAHTIVFLGMNACVPLLEYFCKPTIFGQQKNKYRLNFNFNILTNFGKYYPIRIGIGLFIVIIAYIGSNLVSTSNFEDWKENQSYELVKEVFPTYIIQKILTTNIYQGLSEDKEKIYIIQNSSPGFSTNITILTAIKSNIIDNIRVLTVLGETPGIGNKLFDNDWATNFIGMPLDKIPDSVYDLDFYDTMSGATMTISSVLDSIKKTKKNMQSIDQTNNDGTKRGE